VLGVNVEICSIFSDTVSAPTSAATRSPNDSDELHHFAVGLGKHASGPGDGGGGDGGGDGDGGSVPLHCPEVRSLLVILVPVPDLSQQLCGGPLALDSPSPSSYEKYTHVGVLLHCAQQLAACQCMTDFYRRASVVPWVSERQISVTRAFIKLLYVWQKLQSITAGTAAEDATNFGSAHGMLQHCHILFQAAHKKTTAKSDWNALTRRCGTHCPAVGCHHSSNLFFVGTMMFRIAWTLPKLWPVIQQTSRVKVMYLYFF
jgi:hypothetical protein